MLARNPGIIILGADAGDLDGDAGLQLLGRLDAVRQDKVYRNPRGVFAWDRYGPELALQVQWASQIVCSGRLDEV